MVRRVVGEYGDAIVGAVSLRKVHPAFLAKHTRRGSFEPDADHMHHLGAWAGVAASTCICSMSSASGSSVAASALVSGSSLDCTWPVRLARMDSSGRPATSPSSTRRPFAEDVRQDAAEATLRASSRVPTGMGVRTHDTYDTWENKRCRRKRDGFVPLGDVAGAVDLPGGRILTPRAAAPPALHHFTRLDQVTQLVGARVGGAGARGEPAAVPPIRSGGPDRDKCEGAEGKARRLWCTLSMRWAGWRAGRGCRSRIRHQAAAGSWTMPRQWEIQRTWLNSARAAVHSPAKPNGV